MGVVYGPVKRTRAPLTQCDTKITEAMRAWLFKWEKACPDAGDRHQLYDGQIARAEQGGGALPCRGLLCDFAASRCGGREKYQQRRTSRECHSKCLPTVSNQKQAGGGGGRRLFGHHQN